MAKGKTRRKKPGPLRQTLTTLVIVAALLAAVVLGGGEASAFLDGLLDQLDRTVEVTQSAQLAGGVDVVFIDVGQGDSTLITDGESHVLIDGGDYGAGEVVLAVLAQYDIDTLTAVVATHPHSDHIAGLTEVLDEISAEHIYMSGATSNTQCFEKLLDQIETQNMAVTVPEPGQTVAFHDGFTLTFLSPEPDQSSEDLNECSLVTRIDTETDVVLVCGDAGEVSEQIMLEKGMPVQAAVLRVGHHGSSTSTSRAFLEAVNPRVAVISVGEGNDYGHPHEEVLDRLTEQGCTILRTDQHGTLTCHMADGQITFTTEK